jgi:bifunctional UDP-N-acetylglucosamine pyrophosphorylase / glucosamine-1-phosphate N-acetyltransferase
MEIAIVIMAAGKGTRLKSRRPKVLHQIGGRALVEHVIAAAAQVVEPKDIYVVIGHEAEQVRAALEHTGVRFILQAEQRGTGHALLTARPKVEQYQNLIVLSGDAPMIQTETIVELRDFHLVQQAVMTVLTTRPLDPTGYGRVIRKRAGAPEVTAIVEQKALTREQLSAPEINAGIYAFRAEALFKHIGQLSTDNAHGEYYAIGERGRARGGAGDCGHRAGAGCEYHRGDDGAGRGDADAHGALLDGGRRYHLSARDFSDR